MCCIYHVGGITELRVRPNNADGGKNDRTAGCKSPSPQARCDISPTPPDRLCGQETMTARRGTAMKLLPSYDRNTRTLRSPLFRDLTSYRRFCSNQGPSRQIVGFAAPLEQWRASCVWDEMDEQAAACRKRAAECERMVLLVDPANRSTYLHLAQQWHRMAEDAEHARRHLNTSENELRN